MTNWSSLSFKKKICDWIFSWFMRFLNSLIIEGCSNSVKITTIRLFFCHLTFVYMYWYYIHKLSQGQHKSAIIYQFYVVNTISHRYIYTRRITFFLHRQAKLILQLERKCTFIEFSNERTRQLIFWDIFKEIQIWN